MNYKICPICGERKPFSDFHKSAERKSGRQVYCKKCRSERAEENSEKINAYHRLYRKTPKYKLMISKYMKKNKGRNSGRAKKYRVRLKAQVFNAYGGCFCQCCGESEFLFLSIDHINGGGTKARKDFRRGNAIYHWLKKNEFPNGFRVLCHNCNWGVYVNNGVCPHKRVIKEAKRGKNSQRV